MCAQNWSPRQKSLNTKLGRLSEEVPGNEIKWWGHLWKVASDEIRWQELQYMHFMNHLSMHSCECWQKTFFTFPKIKRDSFETEKNEMDSKIQNTWEITKKGKCFNWIILHFHTVSCILVPSCAFRINDNIVASTKAFAACDCHSDGHWEVEGGDKTKSKNPIIGTIYVQHMLLWLSSGLWPSRIWKSVNAVAGMKTNWDGENQE